MTEQDKKVSFVIPIYKSEQCLENCIKSLLDQDYKNIEIVCVLDGENKKATRIINKFGDKIKKIITMEHGGSSKARNEGYKYTDGDFVSFWDSDCYAEPGMTRMWVKMFNQHPEVSFVYSGYRFNDANQTCFASEPFDPYILTCYNYISTMFPMKRDIFPGFDERLKSLQDWDLWLTLVEKGYKGWFLEGSGFTTEPSSKDSISGIGCSTENWLDRYETVRKKHNIIGRDVCFTGIEKSDVAVRLAKIYKQDYQSMPSYHPHRYKVIYLVGFFPQNMQEASAVFRNVPKDCKKVIHWIGNDILSIYQTPYIIVKKLIPALIESIDYHFCENEQARQLLEGVGIKSQILGLPMEYEKIKRPEEFIVYYEDDRHTRELVGSIVKAVPNIKFESPIVADINNYACLLSITNSDIPLETIKQFLASGRYVITSYKTPYSGYIFHENDISKYKNKIINKLFEYKKLWLKGKDNTEAIKYYKDLIDPKHLELKLNEIKT